LYKISDPDYINQFLLYKCQQRDLEIKRQRGIYEYAQTYAGFLEVIAATNTIPDLLVSSFLSSSSCIQRPSSARFGRQAIRYNIISEIMQAAHIRELKEMSKVCTIRLYGFASFLMHPPLSTEHFCARTRGRSVCVGFGQGGIAARTQPQALHQPVAQRQKGCGKAHCKPRWPRLRHCGRNKRRRCPRHNGRHVATNKFCGGDGGSNNRNRSGRDSFDRGCECGFCCDCCVFNFVDCYECFSGGVCGRRGGGCWERSSVGCCTRRRGG
jgi:hypothetical protein